MSEIDVGSFVDGQVEAVRRALKGEKAIIAVSGGVDSTVSALITHRAAGENLSCVFVDDNFMRLGEPDKVRDLLSSPPLGLPIKILDEKNRFMSALKGLSDAEEKRKAFREAFYQTLSDAAKAEGCKYLIQGTIRADVIETQGGIKTQHNVLGQIGIDTEKVFGFTVIEPVASLFKNQVREIARHLGAPSEISERQPFPGPGLSVRVVGEITEDKLTELKKATAITENALKEFKPDQYFAAIFSGESKRASEIITRKVANSLNLQPSRIEVEILREKGTGVIMGRRAYGDVIAVETGDDPGGAQRIEYATLKGMRSKIQGEQATATRILYLLGKREGKDPIVALRAVKTKDFITASLAEIPLEILRKTAKKILSECANISKVYLDITPKPPGTIEFE